MILIFSAPSGAGKSTLVNYLLNQREDMELSISATTRSPRGNEVNGKEYYFITNDEFERLIQEDAFVEYENVYAGTYYGTLKSEIERIENKGHHVVFDIDVKGGMRLKELYGNHARSFFIAPPCIEELHKRLIGRATDSLDKIAERVKKASIEMEDQEHFDVIIVNDVLEDAKKQLDQEIKKFLKE
ncbi:MAG: guanylate kinase [Paludibacteraceae bacterium]|nr:guanylate kinase [Paludibacteraceae bacterium]